MVAAAWIGAQRAAFRAALARFDARRPVPVLARDDADGLSAGVLFSRASTRAGHPEGRVIFLAGLGYAPKRGGPLPLPAPRP